MGWNGTVGENGHDGRSAVKRVGIRLVHGLSVETREDTYYFGVLYADHDGRLSTHTAGGVLTCLQYFFKLLVGYLIFLIASYTSALCEIPYKPVHSMFSKLKDF
ncbi:hypothetical protein SDC9_191925 [bioreactor metagenome]|uniref:Uncharacterized protein n=1 Tax=bioreactor metagenome TaxID=1076179 RepID=A0A645HZL2_9ZZZZ